MADGSFYRRLSEAASEMTGDDFPIFRDGTVTAADARLILRAAVGLEVLN